jgi:hypothetical protein
MSEAAKVLCPFYREAMLLLDAVEALAITGEYFEAGNWWHDTLRPMELIAERDLRIAVQRRMTSVSEEITAAQRQAMVRAQSRPLQSVRCGCPEGPAELRVGLPHAE